MRGQEYKYNSWIFLYLKKTVRAFLTVFRIAGSPVGVPKYKQSPSASYSGREGLGRIND